MALLMLQVGVTKRVRDIVDGSRKGAQARARLLREGQAMAKVRHPNVITVHDVGIDEQRVFIAMEFLDGCTLTPCNYVAA